MRAAPRIALVIAAVAAAWTVPAVAETRTTEAAQLAEIVRLWRASPSQDVRHLRALQALAARLPAPAEALPVEPAPAVPAVTTDRAWPMVGPIVARFGDRNGTVAHEALRIGARNGGDVLAPAAGTVVFGDLLEGIGLVLIIDHGDEYHSVLAGLGDLDVAAGTRVAPGQRVGRMIAGGYSADLHVELRRNGRPIDPLPWLGVDASGDG